jgi:glutaredoxin
MKLSLLLAAIACCATSVADAQYRYIAPNGVVTFSDMPPNFGAQDVKLDNLPVAPTQIAAATLPYDLSLAASRYPVTLYTAADCDTCDQARTYLKQRGVPFAEKTVKYDNDSTALKKILGTNSVPAMTVGSQKQIGFSDSAWGDVLDVAGYPKTSKLPRDYAYSAPTPVAGVPPPTDATPAASSVAGSAAPAAPAPFPTPPPPTGNAPPGFHF